MNDGTVNVWKIIALVLMVVLAGSAGLFFVSRGGADNPAGTEAATAETTAPSQDAAAEDATDKPDEAQTSGTEETGTTEESGTTKEPAATAGTDATVHECRVTLVDGFTHTRIEGTPVYILEGKNNTSGEIIQTLTSDESGRVTTKLPAGDYTFLFGDNTYYDCMENITIGAPGGPGGDFISDDTQSYKFWKNMLPRQKDNAVCFVLEWKGKEDLDLCVFNASSKTYISAVRPQDGNGGYLIEDDGEGSPGWEVVVIRDHTKSGVYTPFVRDGNALMRGSLSAMETNGVRLSVFDHNGLMFSQEANPEEHAALWMPCYILNGKVVRDAVYEYDPAKYAWAAYTKY